LNKKRLAWSASESPERNWKGIRKGNLSKLGSVVSRPCSEAVERTVTGANCSTLAGGRLGKDPPKMATNARTRRLSSWLQMVSFPSDDDGCEQLSPRGSR
jgi:hypothetical protein